MYGSQSLVFDGICTASSPLFENQLILVTIGLILVILDGLKITGGKSQANAREIFWITRD